MRISVKGSREFQTQIIKFHLELSFKILAHFPEYQSLSEKSIVVREDNSLNVLGKTSFQNNEITINTDFIYGNENVTLKEVYGHELSHAFSTLYFMRNIGHGQEWQDIMKALNLPIRESAPVKEKIKPTFLKTKKTFVKQEKTVKMQCECMFGNTKSLPLNSKTICHCCGKAYTQI